MIVRNGQPFNIDSPWTDENGIQYPANWYRLATDEERAEKGFSWVDDPAPVDDRFYYDVNTPKPLEQIKQRLKNDLAGIRYGAEIAGIIWNDATFATDPQSKVNYLAASLQAQANSSYSVVWKARTADNSDSKFVTLSAADIGTLTNNGIDYITKCFTNEQTLVDAIDAASDIETLQALDLRSGWPVREY